VGPKISVLHRLSTQHRPQPPTLNAISMLH
jgi:hypothetical protein